MPTDAPEAQEREPEELAERTKQRAVKILTLGIFQSVLQHVLALQSEITLFTQALGGDQAATARCLAMSTGIMGVSGLFVNQIGGKLSDALGRKPFFLTGPIVIMLGVAARLRRSKSVATLMAVRVLSGISITFSGTVMCQASLADICSGREMSLVASQIQSAVGVAVVLGPYIESLLLKLSGGNPLSPYKLMATMCLFQLFTNGVLLPETHAKHKRADISEFFRSIASLNPFGFVRAYLGKNAALKKLLTIQTFQYCNDGKVTSDLFQMWNRDHLNWSPDTARDFVAFWGATVTAGGTFLQPYLIKNLPIYAYTSLGNLGVWLGLTLHGIAKRGACMWGGVPFLAPGINGGSALAVKTLSLDIARAEGYGNGEFSAWANNMRALAQSAAMVFVGMWYAKCKERGIYPGTSWFFAALIGAGIPQLLLMTMPRSHLQPPPRKTTIDDDLREVSSKLIQAKEFGSLRKQLPSSLAPSMQIGPALFDERAPRQHHPPSSLKGHLGAPAGAGGRADWLA
eukprot:CAMPEP_0204575596 /NCGR_PEP_ID=MMETSP0661-20131031/41283_1 /ASSEMBLY_ACC=CAM_ASM_000606 /TAXON_ID=109239 /ORGANISM="Alexandrium margalefi, Strain AMGDE01CS-322" /LENGTH=514 /DNA_ID=CAMNT_0051584253 /DNA_START=39 /DNA_END=1582 /DNA_ORIENTATION=-